MNPTLAKATDWLVRHPIWGFIVLIFAFFSFANEFFFDIQNFRNILVQTSTIGLIALGMTLVMINGNIDLSVGAVVALAASLMVDVQSWPIFEGWGN
jgi:ribose transport system permease protein